MQSYTQAGEFTVWGKLRSALWDNMLYYASLIFIALILVIYIALQPNLGLNWERTKAIAAAASNTWGLFVLVLMLGYGLVEVPRNLWMRTKRGYQLNRAYFKVAKLMTERTDADEALDDALIAANAISTVVGQEDMRRPYVEEILKKIPVELMERIKRRRTDNPFGSDPPTEKTFIRLHRQVIKALQDHHRTEAQWTDMTQAVFELEDVNRNMISNEHVFKHTMNRPPIPIVVRALYNPTVEWYWKCLVSPILLRAVSVIFMVLSCMIVWSEVTFFSIHPPLSLFAVFVNLAKSSYNYFALECICLITICYLSLCTYYTVFKIRVLNYYYLASNHQSDEYTLLFSGKEECCDIGFFSRVLQLCNVFPIILGVTVACSRVLDASGRGGEIAQPLLPILRGKRCVYHFINTVRTLSLYGPGARERGAFPFESHYHTNYYASGRGLGRG